MRGWKPLSFSLIVFHQKKRRGVGRLRANVLLLLAEF